MTVVESTASGSHLCCTDIWASGCKSGRIRTESSPPATQNEQIYPNSQQAHERTLCSVLSQLHCFQHLTPFAKTEGLRRLWLCLLYNILSGRGWQQEEKTSVSLFNSNKNLASLELQLLNTALVCWNSSCTRVHQTGHGISNAASYVQSKYVNKKSK